MLMPLLLLSLAPASASPHAAEVRRLTEEATRLAQRSAWSGVERKYNEMTALRRASISPAMHLLGARAARDRGDIRLAHERAQRALTTDPTDTAAVEEASRWLADFFVNYGAVSIQLAPDFRGQPRLVARDGAAFDPRVAGAVEQVSRALEVDRRYTGFLPLGRYRLGATGFDIYGGPEVTVLAEADPASVTDDAPITRVITLGARGAGWAPDQWAPAVVAARDALYTVEAVRNVDAVAPDERWVTAQPDPAALTAHGLTLIGLAAQLQSALDVHQVLSTDTLLVFPPGVTTAAAVADTAVAFQAPSPEQPDAPPTPIRLGDIATIGQPASGDWPMPRDRGVAARYQLVVTAHGGDDVAPRLLRVLGGVPELAPLGFKVEAQEVR